LGHTVVPLPEGNRYLGFLFARAETPDHVENAERAASRTRPHRGAHRRGLRSEED